MRLINKTHWRTDQLKAIIQRVAENELQPTDRKRMTVTIVYRRSRFGRLGEAPYGMKATDICQGWNSGHIKLYVDRVGMEQRRDQLAKTAAHEFAHTRGIRHREMRGPRYTWDDGWKAIYAWANELPLEKKLPKAKPSQTEQDARKYQQAVIQMARFKTKIKRATTGLKFWQRRARYYERKLAAQIIPSPPLTSA